MCERRTAAGRSEHSSKEGRPSVPVLGAVSLLGCDARPLDPEDPDLGCRPPRIESAIVYGTVSDAAGVPVPQANVEILGLMLIAPPSGTIEACIGVKHVLGVTETDEAGTYRDKLEGIIQTEACLVVTAQANGRSGISSGKTVKFRFDLGACTPEWEFDSARVDVVIGD